MPARGGPRGGPGCSLKEGTPETIQSRDLHQYERTCRGMSFHWNRVYEIPSTSRRGPGYRIPPTAGRGVKGRTTRIIEESRVCARCDRCSGPVGVRRVPAPVCKSPGTNSGTACATSVPPPPDISPTDMLKNLMEPGKSTGCFSATWSGPSASSGCT